MSRERLISVSAEDPVLNMRIREFFTPERFLDARVSMHFSWVHRLEGREVDFHGQRYRLKTVNDLVVLGKRKLLHQPLVGKKTTDAIETILGQVGITYPY